MTVAQCRACKVEHGEESWGRLLLMIVTLEAGMVREVRKCSCGQAMSALVQP